MEIASYIVNMSSIDISVRLYICSLHREWPHRAGSRSDGMLARGFTHARGQVARSAILY